MGFSYCVMGAGVQHKLISGMAISPKDGIYGCRWITDLVSTNDVTPYFLHRINVTFRSKGFA
jgi:hypothetical protein